MGDEREATAQQADPLARGAHVARWVESDTLLGDVVVTAEQIASRVSELGELITKDYEDRPPLLVGVLKGAFVFLADIARAI